jgi:hypothetical protein
MKLPSLPKETVLTKTIVCDPEYVLIRWYKKIKEILKCGKNSYS